MTRYPCDDCDLSDTCDVMGCPNILLESEESEVLKIQSEEHLAHLMSQGCAFDQKNNGVLVTFPDGATRLVLNGYLTRRNVTRILDAATKPREFERDQLSLGTLE